MKNKKTIVMGIIIGILLIIIAVMGYVIASGKKGDSVKKETLQETSAGTEEVKSADNTGDTTESSEKQDDQSLDIAGDFYAEIGHDTTWEADGKSVLQRASTYITTHLRLQRIGSLRLHIRELRL